MLRTVLFLKLAFVGLLLSGCGRVAEGQTAPEIIPSDTPAIIMPTPENIGSPAAQAVEIIPSATVVFTPAPVPPTPTAVPALVGSLPACGQILPLLADYDGPIVDDLDPDPQALALLLESVPELAQPALEMLLDNPELVGLAAYRVGEEEQGAYLNADVPMPLASVVKVIHLVAYAEAVANGRLEATSTVLLDDLAAYYLPNIDLGAHDRALADVEENGRVFGSPPAVLLDEVPGMMIGQSSNAATDYLHILLGQRVIEETAVSLGLGSQTAPCPFLGQFLIMGNHAIMENNSFQDYLADPARYGRDVMLLTEAFSSDDVFRQMAINWRLRTRQPNGQTQRLFSQNFNAHGSARDYAGLMARIAQNGLSSPESSYTARRFLEWPMRYADNQALFSNLGYKNGSLPGILTTVYYAYPQSGGNPLVVALFYRDLDRETYRQWRNDFPHDELARWLLYDSQAIPALAAVLN